MARGEVAEERHRGAGGGGVVKNVIYFAGRDAPARYGGSAIYRPVDKHPAATRAVSRNGIPQTTREENRKAQLVNSGQPCMQQE